MGDRANIRWQERDGGVIHFYTHWYGTELQETLAAALDRGRERWGDESYLARIVFSEMMVDGRRLRETTGFGISTWIGDGRDRVLTVDTAAQKVTDFEGVTRSYEEHIARYLRVPEGA